MNTIATTNTAVSDDTAVYAMSQSVWHIKDDPFAGMTQEEIDAERRQHSLESVANDTLTVLLDELALLKSKQSLGIGYYMRVKQLFEITMRTSIKAYEGYDHVDIADL